MNRFKIKAFFRQFSFLLDIEIESWIVSSESEPCAKHGCTDQGYPSRNINPDRVDSAKVSRISPEFLQCQSWFRDVEYQDKIFLLDERGKVLINVPQGTDNEDAYESCDTVGETLLYVKNPDDVFQAVKVEYEEGGRFSVTLYKAPKSFSLKRWVAEQERRAEAQLEASITKIDAGAQLALSFK